MIRRILQSIVRRLGGGNNEEDKEDDSRFVPSVLDASFRYAHGGSAGVDDELAEMEDHAQRLEEQQRER